MDCPLCHGKMVKKRKKGTYRDMITGKWVTVATYLCQNKNCGAIRTEVIDRAENHVV